MNCTNLRLNVFETIAYVVLTMTNRRINYRILTWFNMQFKIYRTVAAIDCSQEQSVECVADIWINDIEAIQSVIVLITDCVQNHRIIQRKHR